MTWTVRDIERDRETIDAIDGHDDRAAAIVAGAYLEDRLARLLQAHSVRPPAFFREKIETARREGILTEKTAERLHTIRQIRNEFAHSLTALTFNSPSIAELCRNLFSIDKIRTLRESAAELFEFSPPIIQAIALLVAPMEMLPDTPRNTYMNSVKFFLFYLEFIKASVLMGEDDFLEVVTEYNLAPRNLRQE